MKNKLFLFLIAGIILTSLLFIVRAQNVDNPTAGLKEAGGGIIDEEGIHTENITSNIGPIKSKLELKIKAINNWLETNASWLKVIFGMVPELSWLFAIVLYFWLLFLLTFVINGSIFGIIITNKNYARIAGAGLFVVLIVTKALFYFSKGLHEIFDFTYNKLLPIGIAVAIIGMIIVALSLIVLAIFAPQVLLAIKNWRNNRKKKDAEEEQETNQEALKKLVEGATGQG